MRSALVWSYALMVLSFALATPWLTIFTLLRKRDVPRDDAVGLATVSTIAPLVAVPILGLDNPIVLALGLLALVGYAALAIILGPLSFSQSEWRAPAIAAVGTVLPVLLVLVPFALLIGGGMRL